MSSPSCAFLLLIENYIPSIQGQSMSLNQESLCGLHPSERLFVHYMPL